MWLTWPNRITIVRALLIAPLIICLLNMNDRDWGPARRVALGLFVLIGIGDAIDGYLARWLRQRTAIGEFLDPLADKAVIICTTILLAIEATGVPGAVLPNWVPVIAVGKDLLVLCGFGLVHVTTGRFIVCPRPLGKACTAVQFAMVALVLAAPDLPRLAQGLPRIAWWTASILAVLAATDYVIVGSRLARAAESKRNGSNTKA